jgi:hypothetical protein
VVATVGRQEVEAKRPVPVLQSRGELMRSMDTATIDDHHDLFPGFAEGRHHLMEILAKLLGLKVGDNFIEDFRRAILYSPNDTEYSKSTPCCSKANNQAALRAFIRRVFTLCST